MNLLALPLPRLRKAPMLTLLGGLSMLSFAAFLLSFAIGRYPVPPATVIAIFVSRLLSLAPHWPAEMQTVVLTIRLPRILAAMMVGAALSTSGAAYQSLFRNPMVSPGILGVSAGASLGAALAILFGWSLAGIQIMAFAFGLLAVASTWLIAIGFGRRGDPVLVMVLGGVIIGTLFSAFVSLVKFVADPNNTLPTITFWLMGSLASVTMRDLFFTAPAILAGLAGIFAIRWKLNVLCFGDEEARALGVASGRLRLFVIVCATLASASAVAISGVIGLVGLIVPHLARLICGPDHRTLIPAAALLGAAFLLSVDDLARAIFPVEIPLGIVSAIIGAPFFIYLLGKSSKGWA